MKDRPPSHGPRRELLRDGTVFSKLISRQTLAEGWAKVEANMGAAGGDRVTVEQFSRAAEKHIGVLANQLGDGTYQPGPLRFVDIPKPSGSTRRLSIPCVRDRVVQSATALILTPHFEAEFETASFGYRPGRSVQQAVSRIQALQREGMAYVIDADIEGYFDNIPHDGLIARLGESMTDGPLTSLISLWLSHAAPSGRGIAQGSPLSPLLANLYLDRLDETFSSTNLRIVRFADDFVILSKSKASAEAALAEATRLLSTHGLVLNRTKTRVTDFNTGFKFLGHLFVRSLAMKVAPEEADRLDFDRLMSQVARRDAAEEEDAEALGETERAQEANGYSPALRNLYLLSPDRRLALRNEAFSIEELSVPADPLTGTPEKWRELAAVPHQKVDRIDIGPDARFLPAALDHALATGTLVCFADGYGATKGTLAPALAPRARRHLAQAATALDEEKRLQLARIIVEGRLRNQRALLRKLCRERDVTPDPVSAAIAALTRIIGRGDTSRIRHASAVPQALGYEGQAAAAYWKGLAALVHPDFGFVRRERKHDPGPSNIALNMLAWLLHRDVSNAVLAAGLHPGFGALHSVDDYHDACVYDLMEEFRAHLVEGLFVYVTNRRIIRPDMFERIGGRDRLKSEGSAALIRAYEARMEASVSWPPKALRQSFRRLVVSQARALARHHENGETYKPFEIDY